MDSMQKLVQIIYISRSTFENTDAINKIEPNVVRILAKSRVNNRKNGLVGVLYFGDGAFFQCLEGEEEAVNTLFTKIEQDTRHKDVRLISKKYISKLSFPDWSMKYAPLDERMRSFLQENNYEKFDPYAFSPEMTHKILGVLIDAYDPTIEIESNPSAPVAVQNTQQTSAATSKLAILSFIMSAIACVLAIYAVVSISGTL